MTFSKNGIFLSLIHKCLINSSQVWDLSLGNNIYNMHMFTAYAKVEGKKPVIWYPITTLIFNLWSKCLLTKCCFLPLKLSTFSLWWGTVNLQVPFTGACFETKKRSNDKEWTMTIKIFTKTDHCVISKGLCLSPPPVLRVDWWEGGTK